MSGPPQRGNEVWSEQRVGSRAIKGTRASPYISLHTSSIWLQHPLTPCTSVVCEAECGGGVHAISICTFLARQCQPRESKHLHLHFDLTCKTQCVPGETQVTTHGVRKQIRHPRTGEIRHKCHISTTSTAAEFSCARALRTLKHVIKIKTICLISLKKNNLKSDLLWMEDIWAHAQRGLCGLCGLCLCRVVNTHEGISIVCSFRGYSTCACFKLHPFVNI